MQHFYTLRRMYRHIGFALLLAALVSLEFLPVQAQIFPDANGQVTSIIPDGSGGFFVAGGFSVLTEKPSGTSVNRRAVAHIFANGQVDRNWNPILTDNTPSNQIGTIVYGLARDNGVLYIAGHFTSVLRTTEKSSPPLDKGKHGILVFLRDVVVSEIFLDTLRFHQVRQPAQKEGSGNLCFATTKVADPSDMRVLGQGRFYLVEIAANKEAERD